MQIASIAAGGQGVTRYNGIPIFVDRAVPGDFVELEIYDLRKDFAHAKITELISGSEMRQAPPCKLFKLCGGCQWQHINYQAQLELKKDILCQVLSRIGGLPAELVLAPLASESALHYRNKVQYPVASPRNSSRILAGYYKEGSHELVNIKHCPVQPEPLDAIIESAKSLAEKAGLSAYDEKSHSGLIRHFLVRYSFSEKHALFTLVLNEKQETLVDELKERLEGFASGLIAKHPELQGVSLNFNSAKGNKILGEKTENIAGKNYIVEKLASKHEHAPLSLKNGVSFILSPESFFQVNSQQAAMLMDLVFDAVYKYRQSTGKDSLPLLIDAFAGVGSIAFWVSSLAQKVIAIEEIEAAAANAREIARENSISNLDMRCGTVETVFPELAKAGLTADIVILDPPRKGVSRESLESVLKLAPGRIVYVSCNPATLARDLKILEAGGYRTLSIQPLDLFPQTFHIESVTILDKKP